MAEGELGPTAVASVIAPVKVPERERPRIQVRLRLAVPGLRRVRECARGWVDRMPAEFRRACSAGRLLFQVVGVAGYAGYFASMHTLMRVVSLGLVAGAWYSVYWIKKEMGAEHGPVNK